MNDETNDKNTNEPLPEDIQRSIAALKDKGVNPEEIKIIVDKIDETYAESVKVKTMNGQNRDDIKPGMEVEIVLKEDQSTGTLTRGTVAEILTNSDNHPHGIKVRLTDGQVGRVQNILSA